MTNIERLGFWVLVDDHEYFVPYRDYPAFKQATVEQIFNLDDDGPGQLRWPDLDIDIEVDALRSPGNFPLSYR